MRPLQHKKEPLSHAAQAGSAGQRAATSCPSDHRYLKRTRRSISLLVSLIASVQHSRHTLLLHSLTVLLKRLATGVSVGRCGQTKFSSSI